MILMYQRVRFHRFSPTTSYNYQQFSFIIIIIIIIIILTYPPRPPPPPPLYLMKGYVLDTIRSNTGSSSSVPVPASAAEVQLADAKVTYHICLSHYFKP